MDQPDPDPKPPAFSFSTTGNWVDHRSSTILINHGYVHHHPASSTAPRPLRPLLFLPGGGLSTTLYTTPLTPTTVAWAPLAAASGRPTYLLDLPDAGHAPPPPPEFREPAHGFGPVEHRTAAEAWATFRLGPPAGLLCRAGWAGSRFPVDGMEGLMALSTPRRRGRGVDAVGAAAVVDAVRRVGECDVVAHSHGAVVLGRALGMMEGGGGVRDVVLVEPGPMREGGMFEKGREGGRTLVVWGDFLDKSHGSAVAWERVRKGYQADGVEEMVLPDRGIRGNSHVMMLDENSEEIMSLILRWLDGDTDV